MLKTDFMPLQHGFHFSNDFVNSIVNTPFGKIESRGRCGGMAFAALDYYYAKILLPTHEGKDFPNNMYAPDGSMLGDYIYKRSLHSLITPSALKFLQWTVTRNDGLFSIARRTKLVEFPRLKRSIDKGRPVVLGLISGSRISEITKSHQVVAHGYDEPAEGEFVVYTYDSNSPNQEVIIESTEGNPYFNSSNGRSWRGFFVQNYRFRRPVYVDLVVDRNNDMNRSRQSHSSIYRVINKGQFSANIKYWALTHAVHLNPEYEDKVLDPGETIVFSCTSGVKA